MSSTNDIVCFGDVMLETIVHAQSLPCPSATFVTDGKLKELGGTSYNLCWYFAQWGRPCRVVAVTGATDQDLVLTGLREASLSADGLVTTSGESDQLLVLVDSQSRFWAIYLRAHLPANAESSMLEKSEPCRALVLTGSRHPRLRTASLELARRFEGELLAFSPSYALYEYSKAEIIALSQAAHVVIMNENELAFTLACTGYADASQFAAELPGIFIVTLGDRGATLYEQRARHSFPSYSTRKGDVIGAGDAFFASFIHCMLLNYSPEEAGLFASLVSARLVEQSGRVRARIDLDRIDEQFRQLTARETESPGRSVL